MSTTVAPSPPAGRLASALGWTVVAVAGAAALAVLALSRGETVNAAWLLVAALCTYAIGYRFYSAFIAAKWWPNATHLFVGTKSRPSFNRSAGVARASSSANTFAAMKAL